MDAPGFMDGGSEITKVFILAMIKTRSVTPTVDAVPVVRCKDCIHHRKSTCSAGAGIAFPPPDDWFCADGELIIKENGQKL